MLPHRDRSVIQRRLVITVPCLVNSPLMNFPRNNLRSCPAPKGTWFRNRRKLAGSLLNHVLEILTEAGIGLGHIPFFDSFEETIQSTFRYSSGFHVSSFRRTVESRICFQDLTTASGLVWAGGIKTDSDSSMIRDGIRQVVILNEQG